MHRWLAQCNSLAGSVLATSDAIMMSSNICVAKLLIVLILILTDSATCKFKADTDTDTDTDTGTGTSASLH